MNMHCLSFQSRQKKTNLDSDFCSQNYWVFIPIGKTLQLEWFVIEQPVELRNLHHPRYLGSHHRVIHFIWKCKEQTRAG